MSPPARVEALAIPLKQKNVATFLAQTFLQAMGLQPQYLHEKVVLVESENKLEWSHYDHNKKSPHYHARENGAWLTKKQHYKLHYEFHRRAMREGLYGDVGNGLTRGENIQALVLIWSRMNDKEKRGVSHPPAQYQGDEWVRDVE